MTAAALPRNCSLTVVWILSAMLCSRELRQAQRLFSASSLALIATIELIDAVGVLASSGTSRRTAFVGESSRRGTGRRMLAMPICGGFGASRQSDLRTCSSDDFGAFHLLLDEVCCRSSCHLSMTRMGDATNGFVSD